MDKNPKALIEIHFLPSARWFGLLKGKDVLLEVNENFQKQSYRNRFRILGPQGPQLLSVPVIKPQRHARSIQDISINYAEPWQRQHLRSIRTAYGKSPYFEHLYPLIEDAYGKNEKHLLPFSLNLLSICLKFLNQPFTYQLTDEYLADPGPQIEDLRDVLNNSQKIKPPYVPKQYIQMFGNEFVTDLSVIDLIFALGAEANSKI